MLILRASITQPTENTDKPQQWNRSRHLLRTRLCKNRSSGGRRIRYRIYSIPFCRLHSFFIVCAIHITHEIRSFEVHDVATRVSFSVWQTELAASFWPSVKHYTNHFRVIFVVSKLVGLIWLMPTTFQCKIIVARGFAIFAIGNMSRRAEVDLFSLL